MKPSTRCSLTWPPNLAAWTRTAPINWCCRWPLAEGPSVNRAARITRHLLTNVETIRRFVDRDVTIDAAEGGPGMVRI
jgi:hypothetical protein